VEEALARLHSLLVRLLIYSGQIFRVTCFNLLLTIAAAVAPAGSCSVAAAARLMQRLPSHMQGPGGQLHAAVRKWLLGGSSSSRDGAGSSHVWLAAGADSMWKQYFSSSSTSNNGTCDAAAAATSQQQQWHARHQDYLSWRSSCDTWLRILLCCSDELRPQLSAAVAGLASMTEQLTSRPYLAAGAAERTLLMLNVLLEGAEEAGRVAVETGQPLPLLTTAAAELAEAVAGPLGRCFELYSSCYWSNPAALAWGEGSNSSNSTSGDDAAGSGGFGLCPAAWAAAARAELAAQDAAAAAVLLARHAGGCWATCGALDSQVSEGTEDSTAAAAMQASKRSLPALLKLLRMMAEVGQQLASKPLPGLQPPAAAAYAAAVEAGLHQAVSAEQSRASAIKVRRHSWKVDSCRFELRIVATCTMRLSGKQPSTYNLCKAMQLVCAVPQAAICCSNTTAISKARPAGCCRC
jgi:hypothetical protein